MKSDKMDIADLLADESFINYCKKASPEDEAYWENYIKENPGRRIIVEYAREKFVQLFNALAEADLDEQVTRLQHRLNLTEPAPIIQMEGFGKRKSKAIISFLLKLTAAAAILLVATLVGIQYFDSSKNSNRNSRIKSFVAAYGERKNIQLPDGTDVTLNGGSIIEINDSYGALTRDVFLKGEAFFDVKHNANLPFIVHTAAMDVKALGTAFNVKAYLNEKITETSLISGLVEVTLKESNNQVMLLHPNQKIKWEHPAETALANNSSISKNPTALTVPDSLLQKLVVSEAGDIKEIGWKENKLIFEDELFADIAVLLERWYAVKIVFKDNSIRNYRFTGIFEREELFMVLDFLKESRNFNYQIEKGQTLTINLSK